MFVKKPPSLHPSRRSHMRTKYTIRKLQMRNTSDRPVVNHYKVRLMKLKDRKIYN